MDIGQPEPALQRTRSMRTDWVRVGDDVANVGEPAVFGDQGPVVPAVAEGPEVEPAHPARAPGRRVQLDGIEIETWHDAPDGHLHFIEGGDWEQHAGGVRLIVLAVALGVAENIDVHSIPAEEFQSSGWLTLTPWMRLIGTDWLVRLVRPRVIRRPRGDSANVKLNMPITRRQISETMAISNGIKPPSANGPIPKAAVVTTMMIVMAAGINHSLEQEADEPLRRHLNQRLISHPEVGEDAGSSLLIKIANAGPLSMGPGQQIVAQSGRLAPAR